jgi:cellulose synthase/poly-beta-1,6-N-acetylglucosamine synthase-like glycosyltransferase
MPVGTHEVLLVENGSADLADLDGVGGVVRYLCSEEPSSATARNLGLAAARGRYVLLTDADCVPALDWVEKMVARLDRSDVVGVGGVIDKHQPSTWTQRFAITVMDGQRCLAYPPALHLPYVAGANAGFLTEALRGVGGFDPELRSGNDVDVCYKLGLAGGRIAIASDAVVEHEDRTTVGAHFRRFRFYAIYQVLLFAKYRHVTGRRVVFDSYPFRRAGSALRGLPGGIAGLARGDVSAVSRALLQLVEAAGVLVGEIVGAVRFRQVYL